MRLEFANQKVANAIQKMAKGDKSHAEALNKAFEKIIKDPYRGKPLKYELRGLYRVHVYSSFVLIYEICIDTESIVIVAYTHHDNAY